MLTRAGQMDKIAQRTYRRGMWMHDHHTSRMVKYHFDSDPEIGGYSRCTWGLKPGVS